MRQPKVGTRIRQEQIAEAALGLVAEQGVRRLSIAAVARRVGLVPSGIYRHYKSKDAVLDAVLDLIQTRLTQIVDTAVAESADPLEQIHGVLMAHIRFIRQGRALPRMIFSEEGHGNDPARKERIRHILTGYLGRIGELVRRGQQQGCIREEFDPETAAMMFMGIIVPAAIRWHLTDGDFDVTRHARQAWTIFQAAAATEDN